MKAKLASLPAYAIAAGLAIFLGENLIAGPGAAEVYKNVRETTGSLLAGITGSPERRPRDLSINGAPLRFSPYMSARPVDDIARDWMAALAGTTTPAVNTTGDPAVDPFVGAANALVAPKVSRVSADFTVIVRFFDGNGPAALDFILAEAQARKTGQPATMPVPGVTVSIRKAGNAAATEVLMSQFDDINSSLQAFAEKADIRKIPQELRPPAGTEVLSDIGDMGSRHTSRTVISRGAVSAENWSRMRADLLSRNGFAVEVARAGKNGVRALHARRETVEADVLYTHGAAAGQTVEVIEIRQPLTEGNMP